MARRNTVRYYALSLENTNISILLAIVESLTERHQLDSDVAGLMGIKLESQCLTQWERLS